MNEENQGARCKVQGAGGVETGANREEVKGEKGRIGGGMWSVRCGLR